MKHLLIIGARGFGREVYNILPECIGYGEEYVVKGYLDDKYDALDGLPNYPPIISSVEEYKVQPDDVFVCALGDVKWKRHYVDLILEKGGEFINIIHKTSFIRNNTQIGVGCIVFEWVGISCDIKIGNFVTFQTYSTIGHDVRVGDYCHLGCKSFMGGYSSLDEGTTIQTGAIVFPHTKIGRNCLVGAGSVVIRKVKDGDKVFGNPAKRIDF